MNRKPFKVATVTYKPKRREDYDFLELLHGRHYGVTAVEVSDYMGWAWAQEGNRRMKERGDRLEGLGLIRRVGVGKHELLFPLYSNLKEAQDFWIKQVEG